MRPMVMRAASNSRNESVDLWDTASPKTYIIGSPPAGTLMRTMSTPWVAERPSWRRTWPENPPTQVPMSGVRRLP
jgi:hypothetical protein